MSAWIDGDFLLKSDTAKVLYHEYAENTPIIDYHNHLNPQSIAEDKNFRSITEAWLADHYKWRLMRAFGVEERLITGDAGDREKFRVWAEVLPYTLNNPVFHWSQLELARYFGVTELLNKSNADYIFDLCNEKIASPEYTPCGLLRQMNVELLCTTDDPIDSLDMHRVIATQQNKPEVRPAWRADKLLATDDVKVWGDYVAKLSAKSSIKIHDLGSLREALEVCQVNFVDAKCRVADVGINRFYDAKIDLEQLDRLVSQLASGEPLNEVQRAIYHTSMLYVLCELNHSQDWAQQIHIGAIRNNNRELVRDLGVDTGSDSMSDYPVAAALSEVLGELNEQHKLAPTILYNLNPKDGDALATMAYNFNYNSTRGKMQYGAAWWFLDNYNGMTKQLDVISDYGLLSQFVGMLTDSRSFLSFTRHEYFRRILCQYFGFKIDRDELPREMTPFIGEVVKDICYNNTKSYFKF